MSMDPNNTSQPPAMATATPKQGRVAALFGWFATQRANQRHLAANRRQMADSTLPAPTNAALAEQVQQLSIDSDTPISTIVAMLAGQTQDVSEVVESYDEDKEHPLGKIATLVATVLAYVLPWTIAFYAGSALGYTYSLHRPFNLLETQTAFYYMVSWAYEFGLVGLMLALVRQYKRVIADNHNRKSMIVFVALVGLFLVLAVTSASAQWILFEHNINLADRTQVIGALFRTLGTPLTDLVSAVVLAVLYIRSLDQHLITLQKKNDAVIAINRKKLANRLEVINAAMEVKNTLQKEADYQQKNELANSIIGMFSEHAIDAIQSSLDGKKQDTGSSYRRDGYR